MLLTSFQKLSQNSKRMLLEPWVTFHWIPRSTWHWDLICMCESKRLQPVQTAQLCKQSTAPDILINIYRHKWPDQGEIHINHYDIHGWWILTHFYPTGFFSFHKICLLYLGIKSINCWGYFAREGATQCYKQKMSKLIKQLWRFLLSGFYDKSRNLRDPVAALFKMILKAILIVK